MQNLKELFYDQLKDAYSAETQLTQALPKMIQSTQSKELRSGFETHLKETENQLRRIEQVCQLVNCSPDGNPCEAMEGLITEGEEMCQLDGDPQVRDAGLIAAAQKVEHYEIALYGTLCTWAKQLGYNEVQQLLHQTLDEEKATNDKLTQLAKQQINTQAAQ